MADEKPFTLEYLTEIHMKFSLSAIISGASYFTKKLISYSPYLHVPEFDITIHENPVDIIKTLHKIAKRRLHIFTEGQTTSEILNKRGFLDKLTEKSKLLVIYDIPAKICAGACCDKDSSFCIWTINSKVMDDAEFATSGFKKRTFAKCNCAEALALARWAIETDKKSAEQRRIAGASR